MVSSLNISSFDAAENSQCKKAWQNLALGYMLPAFSLSVLLLTIAANQTARENSDSYCKIVIIHHRKKQNLAAALSLDV